jgi:aldose 1-epimerase
MHIVTLTDPSSPVAAQFVPAAGMIGISLTDSGVELLGQRHGLDAYVTAGKTMGIPILYPWANRLGDNSYTVDGEVVTLAPGASGVHGDQNGLPIHGLLAGYRGWRVMTESANELIAELDFGADPALLASFPFPHLLVVRVGLVDRTLSVHTTVAATADKAVPLCFGFHPYLQLPELPRAQWTIETPALRHLTVDQRRLPTGETSAQPATSESLSDKAFDDGYDQVTDGAVFAVSGGGRRIEVRFDYGFPAAQIFAPPGEDLVCFEPMAAPTDALRRGGYRCARPGEPAVAQFSIRV